MSTHLISKHQFSPNNKKSKVDLLGQVEQERIDRFICKFLSSSNSSLSLVENSEFRDLMNYFEPLYKIPSRETMKNLILTDFKAHMDLVKMECFRSDCPSYSIDLWKAKSKDYYICVFLHFIDNNWCYKAFPVAFRQVKGSHTAQAIGFLVYDILKPFLNENATPFAGVVDGGDIHSVKFTSAKFIDEELYPDLKIKDQLCICHQLNNVIKRMLSDYLGTNYLAEWRTFVKKINTSNPFRELWQRCCNEVFEKEITLQIDTETRWSSTVSMLEKAVFVQAAVERIYNLTLNHEYQAYHEFVPNWDKPQSKIRSFLTSIVDLFKPTLKAIQNLEGEKYVTQSLILLQLCQLEANVELMKKKYPQQSNNQLHIIIGDMTSNLNKLWDSLPVDSVIASILDPRVKLFKKIPEPELKEALNILEKEYEDLLHIHCQQKEQNSLTRNNSEALGLFSILSKQSTSVSPSWKREITTYIQEDTLAGNSDPLDWWKVNERVFPILSKLAKRYLAVPASQAGTERIFSIAKDVMGEKRTSLQPDLFEALVLTSKYLKY